MVWIDAEIHGFHFRILEPQVFLHIPSGALPHRQNLKTVAEQRHDLHRGVDVDEEIARKGKRRTGLVSLDVTIGDPVPSQFFFRDTSWSRRADSASIFGAAGRFGTFSSLTFTPAAIRSDANVWRASCSPIGLSKVASSPVSSARFVRFAFSAFHAVAVLRVRFEGMNAALAVTPVTSERISAAI